MKKCIVLSVLFLLFFLYASSVQAALLAPESETGQTVGVTIATKEPVYRLAQGGNYGLDETADKAGIKNIGGSKTLPERLGDVIYGIIGFIGVIFLGYAIYGGFLWMTAGGNKEQISKGAAHIKNGAIGVIIILASYAITYFVFTQLVGTSTTGTTQTNPCLQATGRPNGCDCTSGNQCESGGCLPNLGMKCG